jgi:catalase (peroxidase I)
MLVTDLGFRYDSTYRVIAEEFADDIESLEFQFKHAWYRLTTADMGPIERCLGDMVPPAQEFQSTLPAASSDAQVNYTAMYYSIKGLIDDNRTNIAAFSNLAYRCAFTFRETDYSGGCNGARIRFAPESEWPGNEGTSDALDSLNPIKEAYPDASMADIIVLSGQVAIEAAGGLEMPFCGGRVDANSSSPAYLAPRSYEAPILTIRDDMEVKGLTLEEGVALFARPTGDTLSNEYFVKLKAGDGEFSDEEKALLEAEFLEIVDRYIEDNGQFLQIFAEAWIKMMTADRYDGPHDNLCTERDDLERVNVTDSKTGSGASLNARFVTMVASLAVPIALAI